MKTTIKSAFLLTALILQAATSTAQQPVHLWSYAHYRTHASTGATLLVDTGRFYYSAFRGLTFDSSLEYFFYRVPTTQPNHSPDDFPNLNPWYTHRYHTIAPRVVAQFDSCHAWRYQVLPSPSGLQPLHTTRKVHTLSRMDTLQITFEDTIVWGGSQLYHFAYDQSGRPETCHVVPSDTISLTRDSAGRVVRKKGDYLLGSVVPYISIYHYNASGLLDTVTVCYSNGGGNLVPWRHDILEYDALGRLHKVRKPGGHSLHTYQYPNLDSFVYDSGSNRCTDIYEFYYGNTTPAVHHIYSYDAAGRLASYARGSLSRTFERNAAGFITQITETLAGNPIYSRTYYYYDSLGAAGVSDAVVTLATIEIYPNPTSDQIFLHSAKKLSAYQLCSITGKVLQSGSLSDTQKSISVKGLPPGAYVLYVLDTDGNRQAAQVMKR